MPGSAARAQGAAPGAVGSDAVNTCATFLIFNHVKTAVERNSDRASRVDAIRDDVFGGQSGTGICLAYMLDERSIESAKSKVAFAHLKDASQNTTQAGSGSSASGSTNLVSKNSSSNLLSLASEYGGLTQSTSGQTTTLSGTLAGVPLQLESKSGLPLFAECTAATSKGCIRPTTLDRLSRVSYAVGVGTGGGSAGTGTAGAASGKAQPVSLTSVGSSSAYSLNQVTAKFAAFRQMPTARDLATASSKIDTSQITNPVVQQDLRQASEILLDAYPDHLAAAWQPAAQAYARAVQASGVDYKDALAGFLVSLGQVTAEEDLAYENAIKPTVSGEYDLNTPANQPSNSVFKLIVSWIPPAASAKEAGAHKGGSADASGPADPAEKPAPAKSDKTPGGWTLTLNAAASIYNAQPSASIPSARRLRDVQIAAEADYKFPTKLPIVGPPTVSGAFYYQDQTSASILKAPISGLPITGLSASTNQVFTRTGPLDIGQIKLSFGSTGSGFRVPLAFTVANRTELLQGMDVKGQIGISYDFDSLLSK
jgi:hypothetical protein